MHHMHTSLRARRVLDDYTDIACWTKPTQVQVLCDFVDYLDKAAELSQYLNAVIKWGQAQAEVTTEEMLKDAY